MFTKAEINLRKYMFMGEYIFIVTVARLIVCRELCQNTPTIPLF